MSKDILVGAQIEDESQFGSEISDEDYDRWMRYGAALVEQAKLKSIEDHANRSKGSLPGPTYSLREKHNQSDFA